MVDKFVSYDNPSFWLFSSNTFEFILLLRDSEKRAKTHFLVGGREEEVEEEGRKVHFCNHRVTLSPKNFDDRT